MSQSSIYLETPSSQRYPRSQDLDLGTADMRSLAAQLNCIRVATCTLLPSGMFQPMSVESQGASESPANRSHDPLGRFVETMNWAALHHDRVIAMDLAELDQLSSLGIGAIAVAPLRAPVFAEYPGVLQAFRAAGEKSFSERDLHLLAEAASKLTQDGAPDACAVDARTAEPRVGDDDSECDNENPTSNACGHCIILTAEGKPWLNERRFLELGPALRQQLIDQCRLLSGDSVVPSTRRDLILVDERGVKHSVKAVSLRTEKVPHDGQLSHGPLMLFCFIPSASEYLTLTADRFVNNNDVARLIPALQFMADDAPKVPSLKEIARFAHFSPFHFHRRCTEIFGITPKHFLLAAQIAQAKRMLKRPGTTLSDVAAACGFAQQSHFSTRFKQATGLTPSGWRRMTLREFPE